MGEAEAERGRHAYDASITEPGTVPQHNNHLYRTCHSPTTMDPIQEAIAEIDSCVPGTSFSYTKLAAKYSLVRSTLIRRHRRETQPRQLAQLSLHPH